jgi:type I restriction enzyme S subunit
MTRPNLRNIAVVPEAYDGAICTTGFAILRPRNPDDSAFVFEIVKSDHFTEAMSRLAEAKSLYPAVDEDQVRRFQIIHPPAPARAHFGRTINKLFEVYSKLHTGTEIGQAVFSSLLSRAFTGELTAEWEAANAEEIAKQQAFHERLPRLLVLALVAQKAKRASRAAAEVLVTALMKYVFLLQMEGNSGRRRLYHFVPYHYGPFAKELYADLKKLQAEGLVTVDNDSEEEKTRIALADPGKAEQALAELPDDLKEDVAAVIEKYGRLDHNALLTAVYEKYPAYARKSRLKRRTRGS